MNGNSTELEEVVHNRTRRAETVDREGLALNPSPLAPEYLFPSKWVPVLFPNFPLPNTCSHSTTIRYVTLHFRDRRGRASLRYRHRSYGSCFRTGPKAARYSVNIAQWAPFFSPKLAFPCTALPYWQKSYNKINHIKQLYNHCTNSSPESFSRIYKYFLFYSFVYFFIALP